MRFAWISPVLCQRELLILKKLFTPITGTIPSRPTYASAAHTTRFHLRPVTFSSLRAPLAPPTDLSNPSSPFRFPYRIQRHLFHRLPNPDPVKQHPRRHLLPHPKYISCSTPADSLPFRSRISNFPICRPKHFSCHPASVLLPLEHPQHPQPSPPTLNSRPSSHLLH